MISLKEVEILQGVCFSLAMLAQARTINKDAVYTITEAAFLLNCDYQSVAYAIKRKHLTAGSIGRSPRIKGSDLLAWVEAGGKTGRRGSTSKRRPL